MGGRHERARVPLEAAGEGGGCFGAARWITDKYILVMLGIFPLFTGLRAEAYTDITGAKFRFFSGASALWLAAVLALLAMGALRGERFRFRPRPVHGAVGLFLAVSVLSAALSPFGRACLMGMDRYDGLVTTLLYVGIFFGVSLLARPRRRYAWALGLSAAVCCGVAVLQLAGYDPFRLYPAGLNYYDKYEALNAPFLGTIGNTGLLAAYLCLCAPFLTVYGILSPRPRDTLLLLPAALCVFVLLFCDVDAGLAALAGTVLVTVPVVMRTRRGTVAAAAVSSLLLLTALAVLYAGPWESGTLGELRRVLHGELADEFGSHRGQIWKQAWQNLRDYLWLGSGPGTQAQRLSIRWSRYIEALGRERVVTVTNAHNVFLGQLLCTGLLGGVSYLAGVVLSLFTWLRRRHLGPLYPALGSAFFCYMIQDFFGLGLCLTAPLVWVVWGLLETEDRV